MNELNWLVRPAIYGRVLELESSFDDSVPLHDDVFVGPRLRRLVPTTHEQEIGRDCHWFCQSSQSRYCKTRRTGRSGMVCNITSTRKAQWCTIEIWIVNLFVAGMAHWNEWWLKKNGNRSSKKSSVNVWKWSKLEPENWKGINIRLRDNSGHLPFIVCLMLCWNCIYICSVDSYGLDRQIL